MPHHSKISSEGWKHLMASFGINSNMGTHTKLLTAYSEPHRAYHTLEHISACFRHLDNVSDQAIFPHEIELALWFHDVIYKPFSASNEEDSADMAKLFLSSNTIESNIIERIYNLILLTKDHGKPHSKDGQLMLDIDLSILGASKNIYAQFEADVRTEYKRVPSFIFKTKRKEILQSFADRARIYHTDYFFEALERQAKINLEWAINAL